MAEKRKPKILLSNDDGFWAMGIRVMARHLAEHYDVTIVAPVGARSGFSSALTTALPIKICKEAIDIPGVTCYTVSGTPVDCVKLAMHLPELFRDEKPDLVVSGINKGLNDGICVVYSGTVGVAQEAAIFGIPALAVSTIEAEDEETFETAARLAMPIVEKILEEGLPKRSLLSLNVPNKEAKEVKVAAQSNGQFVEEFTEGVDGYGGKVYWCSGYQVDRTPEMIGDLHYLAQGYATLTPIRVNFTDQELLKKIEHWV